MIDEYLYNGFTYKVEVDQLAKKLSFDLQYPDKFKKPNYLYKYFPLNKLTCSSFLNNYLFSPHPMMNNDKYDSSSDLIDYSELSLESFINRLSKETKSFTEEEVIQLFNSENKWILERAFGDINHMLLFMKFGIISFTENDRDILMWAYYAQNNGIVLKFDVSLLPDFFLGPFPINYSESLNKIDFSKHHPALSVHYQTNVKYKSWEKEREWRFVTYNPNGAFNPYFSKKDINSRKIFYNTNALKEVILGYDFIQPNEIEYNKKTNEYGILNLNRQKNRSLRKIKMNILNQIIKLNLPCSQIIRHRFEYSLNKREENIEKITTYKFKVIHGKEP